MGLLQFSADDLSAPPRPVPPVVGGPRRVVAAFALQDGLASLSPVIAGDPPGPRWLLQWYAAAK